MYRGKNFNLSPTVVNLEGFTPHWDKPPTEATSTNEAKVCLDQAQYVRVRAKSQGADQAVPVWGEPF